MTERVHATRATFNLPTSELQALKRLAKRHDMTVTWELREAITVWLFIAELAAEGSTFLVKRPDGEMQEMVFKAGWVR